MKCRISQQHFFTIMPIASGARQSHKKIMKIFFMRFLFVALMVMTIYSYEIAALRSQ